MLVRVAAIFLKIEAELDAEYGKIIANKNTAKRTTDTLWMNAKAAGRMAAELEREVTKLGTGKEGTGRDNPFVADTSRNGNIAPSSTARAEPSAKAGRG